MTCKHAALFLFIVGILSFGRADQLVLHEGKIIKGTIIKEDKQELMIRLANNMFLSVDKKKIKEIIREDKGPSRPTITMQTLQSSTSSTSTAVRPAVSPSTFTPRVISTTGPRNIKPSSSSNRQEKDGAVFIESAQVQIYPVTGKDFTEVKAAILARDGGKGFMKKGRRQASKTDFSLSWDGKTKNDGGKIKWNGLVFETTATITAPEWKAMDGVDVASVRQWDAFIGELERHDQGHLEIYRSALRLLNQAFSNLEAADEASLRATSKNVVMAWRARTEKKQDGHDRREKEVKGKTGKKSS